MRNRKQEKAGIIKKYIYIEWEKCHEDMVGCRVRAGGVCG